MTTIFICDMLNDGAVSINSQRGIENVNAVMLQKKYNLEKMAPSFERGLVDVRKNRILRLSLTI